MTMDPFILWGARGHAKVLASTIARLGGTVIALVDNDPNVTENSLGIPILTGEDGLHAFLRGYTGPTLNGAVAIGGGRGRDRFDR